MVSFIEKYKILFFTVILGLVAGMVSNAKATITAVAHDGYQGICTQYVLADTEATFDGVVLNICFNLDETIVQASTTDYHTSKENYLCWGEDPDNPLCPNDDIGGGVYRMPTIMALEEAWANGVTQGAALSVDDSEKIYRGFWYEYIIKEAVDKCVAEFIIEGMNDIQKKRALKYVYFGNGIDLTTAEVIADDYILDNIEPTADDLGTIRITVQYIQVLTLFGEVGWFN